MKKGGAGSKVVAQTGGKGGFNPADYVQPGVSESEIV